MTVKELIALLSRHDPDLPVMVDGYEGGVGDLEPENIIVYQVRRDCNTEWYYGDHEVVSDYDEPPFSETATTTALGLCRK